MRIVTHGLRKSSSTLWGRLAQHRGTLTGRDAGGGNHRGSVFRLHVGTALLGSSEWPNDVRRTWAVGGSTDAETRTAEYPLELSVSERIGRMPFLWLAIGDPPNPQSDRGVIERNTIALLSNYAKPPMDPPSSHWLGRSASSEAIRQSGLWNVNHVRETADLQFLNTFSFYVETMSTSS